METIAVFIAKMFDPVILIVMGGFFWWEKSQDEVRDYIETWLSFVGIGMVALFLHGLTIWSIKGRFDNAGIAAFVVFVYTFVWAGLMQKKIDKNIFTATFKMISSISGVVLLMLFNTVSGVGGVVLMFVIAPKYWIEWYDVLFAFIVPFYGIISALFAG